MSRSEVGELLVWVTVGMVVGLPLLLGHLLALKEPKRLSKGLFFLLGALVFFGVVMDTVHNLVVRNFLADVLLQLDLDAISPFAISVAQLLRHQDTPLSSALASAAIILPAMNFPWVTVGEAVQGALRLDLVFTLLEDGGEMIVVSLVAGYCRWVLQARAGDVTLEAYARASRLCDRYLGDR
jgi:hypothetical protein